MRPGIFRARPLVVVTPQRSPFGPTASQLMVPQKLHVLAFGDQPERALHGVLGAAVLELPT